MGTTTFALWRVHWMSLRRLWATRLKAGDTYLFVVSSLGVAVTAFSAGRLVTRVATLLLGTLPASAAGSAEIASASLLFLTSWLLWRHHWRLLRGEATSSVSLSRARSAADAVPLPDRPLQRGQRAA